MKACFTGAYAADEQARFDAFFYRAGREPALEPTTLARRAAAETRRAAAHRERRPSGPD